MFKYPTAKQFALARDLGIEVDPEKGISRQQLSRLLELKLEQREAEDRRHTLKEKGIKVGTRVRYHADHKATYVVSSINNDYSVTLKGRGGAYNPMNLEVVAD